MAETKTDVFLEIRSTNDLADYLNIPLKTLTYFSFSGQDFYTEFTIPKKNGVSTRTIAAPRKKLKELQVCLLDALSGVYSAPDCVHGFVAGKSIATNAALHTNKVAVVKIDLEDFFPSITAGRIRGLFGGNLLIFPTMYAML